MTRFTPPIRVAVVTGTRAEFGLLAPIMRAIRDRSDIGLKIIATGTHLLAGVETVREIREEFGDVIELPMHDEHFEPGRSGDVRALGCGITNLGKTFDEIRPDVVLVLGDRIEALAGAVAASVGGFLLAHVHGGDRAEGVADESMRHAITKLAHLHFPATETSRERIIRMGEKPEFIFNVGSPAIDGLEQIQPMDDESLRRFGIDPLHKFAVVLHHPAGLEPARETSMMMAILEAIENGPHVPQFVLCAPNFDAGREAILSAIADRRMVENLPRPEWLSLLTRASAIIGNSSAALIECAALGLPAVNIGPRQNGRERAGNAVDVPETEATPAGVSAAIEQALALQPPFDHPYGTGQCGPAIARVIADLVTSAPPLRKLNTY